LRPGLTFRELSERAWTPPEKYAPLAAGVVIHGVGMCNEYPQVYPGVRCDVTGYDGVLEPNMTVCVESYIGEKGGIEGVKLEQMVLVTERGAGNALAVSFRGCIAGLIADEVVAGLGELVAYVGSNLAEDSLADLAAHHDRRPSRVGLQSITAFHWESAAAQNRRLAGVVPLRRQHHP
jgi:hypothetical protein